MGKLFTSVLNSIKTYIDQNDILNINQAGFRQKHLTTDNIFILHILAEHMKNIKGKLFCTIVDFRKAFDSVWRQGLWYKLSKYNLNGKFLNIVKICMQLLKAVFQLTVNSLIFFSARGLRQGEKLSPIRQFRKLHDRKQFPNFGYKQC